VATTDAIDVTSTFTKLSPDISTGDAISELENRINRLRSDITETANTLRAEREERRGSLETLRSDMTSEFTSHAEEERRQSVRELRSEIARFWFITVGFILQGIGSIIGALP
jgi:chromosome segregation ATPase